MDNISVADDRIVPQFVHITQTQSCRCFDINRHFIEIMVRKLCLNQLRSTHKLVLQFFVPMHAVIENGMPNNW